MRFKSNRPQDSIYQGQLCLVTALPSDDNQNVPVAIQPPGKRILQAHDQDSLRTVGVTKETGLVHSYYRSKCRRHQYPLELFVASTVHKTMGNTIPAIPSSRNSQFDLFCGK